MSFQAMTWATEQELPAMQKIVLLMMANRTNHETGLCFPSHDLLAKECGMAKRSVIAQIEKLEAAGMIEVFRSVNDKKMKNVNKYKLNMHSKINKIGSAGDALGSAGDALGSAGDALGGSAGDAHKPVTIEPVKEPVKEPKDNALPRKQKNKEPKEKTETEILADYGVEGQLAKDFLKVRRAKKAPVTITAMDGIKEEANKAGISVIDAVTICAKKGWRGFNASWNWQEQKSPMTTTNRTSGSFKQPQPRPDYSVLGGNFIDSTAKVIN
jgi:DNA-binding Lrp family transcriptional regulator